MTDQSIKVNIQNAVMKTICHPILATLVFLLVNAPSTEASLYLTGDPYFGPNSVTVDTSTELGWLNLSESVDLSYNQVTADMQPGGIFNGYRYATLQEVFGLCSSAGIPGPGYYPLSTPAIQNLFSLIGSSGNNNGQGSVWGLSGNLELGGQASVAAGIYATGVNGVEEFWLNDSTAYGITVNYPGLSSWLVKEVPEPTTLTLLLAGGFILFGQARRQKG